MIYNLIFVTSVVAVMAMLPFLARAGFDPECANKTKVDPSKAEAIHGGKFFDNMTEKPTDNFNLKRYVLCVLNKSELMSKEGKFKKQSLLSKYSNEKVKNEVDEILHDCLLLNSAAQHAYTITKCFYQNSPNHTMLI